MSKSLTKKSCKSIHKEVLNKKYFSFAWGWYKRHYSPYFEVLVIACMTVIFVFNVILIYILLNNFFPIIEERNFVFFSAGDDLIVQPMVFPITDLAEDQELPDDNSSILIFYLVSLYLKDREFYNSFDNQEEIISRIKKMSSSNVFDEYSLGSNNLERYQDRYSYRIKRKIKNLKIDFLGEVNFNFLNRAEVSFTLVEAGYISNKTLNEIDMSGQIHFYITQDVNKVDINFNSLQKTIHLFVQKYNVKQLR